MEINLTSECTSECMEKIEMENNLRGECTGKCTNQETCSKILDFIKAVKSTKGNDRQEKVIELSKYLSQNSVCLQTQICLKRTVKSSCKTKEKQQNSVLKAILTLPEGCAIVKKQLDSLVILEEDEVIGVKLGPKTLFSDDEENSKFEQTTVLEELLSARNKMPMGRSHSALTGLIKHPVMVVFILKKWEKVRDSFFLDLR